MKDLRQEARTGKVHQPGEMGEAALDTTDLTCQEAQIEELLSKGESTESGADVDDEQDDNLEDRKSSQ